MYLHYYGKQRADPPKTKKNKKTKYVLTDTHQLRPVSDTATRQTAQARATKRAAKPREPSERTNQYIDDDDDMSWQTNDPQL
jgi:hypothetical protein